MEGMIAASKPHGMLPQLKQHRFRLEDYEAMIARGILTEDDRVELIHGAIVDVSPIGDRHTACVKRLNRLFTQIPARAVTVSIQDPIVVPPDSEPQPDAALLRPAEDFYESGKPRPNDVLLIVEVADSSLEFDREVKMPLYAHAGIPEAWVVDVESKSVEVYTEPRGGRYTQMRTYRSGESIAPRAFPDHSFAVDLVV
jgi:Uma2 family endonuclease